MKWILSILCLVSLPGVLYASPDLPSSLRALVPEDRRAEVQEILADPTFNRELAFVVHANLQVFTYLLDHPDLNAALARALHIAPYEVVRSGPGQYRGADADGNAGTIEVFGAEGHERVFVERGVSSGWWFGEIGGRVVALVAFAPEADSVRGTVTVWARIDQGFVDGLLRFLKPFLGGLLDRKLKEQFSIPERVAEAAAQHPDRFCPLLGAVSDGSPEERQALAGLAGCLRVEG
jgi:hypothetical protein